MEKIGLVIVSSADLPQSIIEKERIGLVPVKLAWPEIENLPGSNTFQKMRELEKRGIKSFGKTSQASMKDFLDAFNLQLEKFNEIVCIVPTSKLSGTHNSATQARKFLAPEKQKRVFIIDSLSASAGEGVLDLRAIDLIQAGKNTAEIVKELTESVSAVHLYLMFEDPKWLEASGRISHLVAGLIRGLGKVGIRPVLEMKNGVLETAGVRAGAKDILAGLLKQFETDVKKFKKENDKISLVITHGDNLEVAQKLKGLIEERFSRAEIGFLNIIDDVVGILIGPNAIALAWL